MADRDLVAFAETFHQDLISLAEADGAEALLPEVFTSTMLETLVEVGEVEEGEACYLRDRGVEVSGYGIEEDEILNLFGTIHHGEVPPATTGQTDVEVALRRMQGFWDRCRSGPYHARLEDAAPAFDMAQRVHEAAGHIRRLRLIVLTDGISRLEHLPTEQHDGVEVVRAVWDIQRLWRLRSSGMRREAIEIDFVGDHGGAIPCLTAGAGASEYRALLAIFPATVLNDIYAEYGPRLLELNVRSFLQARGKVNKGIRDTLINEPDHFLAYNNGISATASGVELTDDGRAIARIRHLQIVNGGQTTASIHHAVRRDRADVSRAYIQAKITIVPEARLDQIVPLISRYANSQNRISEADLTANHPFHVRVEELSRLEWAPATDGTGRQTRWFYERARGQYADALAREDTPARQREFKLRHPSSQRMAKTDLAKFENTWDQLPHIASRGAQKSFVHFMERLEARGRFEPDAEYLRALIAKAILFKRTERLVTEQAFGGYRANIVTYAIALLCHNSMQRLDLGRIWERQDIDEPTARTLIEHSHLVYDVITDPPGAANVTEYCKREACWQRVRELPVTLPQDLILELLPIGRSARTVASAGPGGVQPEEQRSIDTVAAFGSDAWLALSSWAKETGNLQPWERSLAFSLGKLVRQGRTPSRKQATQGKRILDEAQRLGFRWAAAA
ncbi:MAG: AIPR family protein [Solirubrobacteraceae bacterium]